MKQPESRIIIGDALAELRKLPTESVDCCVTSPPYWQLRDYGVEGQIGLEATPDEYVAKLVDVFREVRRVLRSDGTLWLNLGDTYLSSWPHAQLNSAGQTATKTSRPPRPIGLKEKDLVGIPWRVALALQADGWYLRSDIIWHKPNPMPESVKDRPTKAHEYLFLLSKSMRYYYDIDAIREPHLKASYRKVRLPWSGPRYGPHVSGNTQRLDPKQMLHPLGKNKRTVWTIPIRGYKGNHFSTFPEKLVEPCILAGAPRLGIVLDPFAGTGTVLKVATNHERRGIAIEVNSLYLPSTPGGLILPQPDSCR